MNQTEIKEESKKLDPHALNLTKNPHQSSWLSRRRKQNAVTRVISFSSGKGGVGKTAVVVNLALALARSGRSVLILDGDLGLANVDVMLGLSPHATLEHLLNGSKRIEEVLLKGPEGVDIIPASSGIEEMSTLSKEARTHLLLAVEEIAEHYDYLLVDTQAGIGSAVLHLASASHESVVVVNNQPTSLTDAYALIKILNKSYAQNQLRVLVNECCSHGDGLRTFRRLERAVERFLQAKISFLGAIPYDPSVGMAIQEQRALLELFPSSSAALAVNNLAREIDAKFVEVQIKGGMQFFFKKLLDLQAEQERSN